MLQKRKPHNKATTQSDAQHRQNTNHGENPVKHQRNVRCQQSPMLKLWRPGAQQWVGDI